MDPKVYPITSAFREFVKNTKPEPDDSLVYNEISDVMETTLGEYEHGTASARDLLPNELKNWMEVMGSDDLDRMHELMDEWALQTIRAVYEDFLLYMVNR